MRHCSDTPWNSPWLIGTPLRTPVVSSGRAKKISDGRGLCVGGASETDLHSIRIADASKVSCSVRVTPCKLRPTRPQAHWSLATMPMLILIYCNEIRRGLPLVGPTVQDADRIKARKENSYRSVNRALSLKMSRSHLWCRSQRATFSLDLLGNAYRSSLPSPSIKTELKWTLPDFDRLQIGRT